MRAAILVLCATMILSCAGQQSGVMMKPPSRVPTKLILEKTISGKILVYDLNHPSGAAVDAHGNLYISDTDNHRLIKFDPQFNAIRDYGGYGSGVGRFLNPEDIIIDRGLNLYVLDTGNRRIVQLDARLNFVAEIFPEDDPEEIISNRGILSGLQISPLGELTVADYDNSRLIKMDNFGRFSRYIGDFGYGRGALLNPLGMAADDDGRTYVADAGNGRIAVYDDYGNYLYQIGGDRLLRPSAVAVSKYGTLWAADEELKTVFAFATNGELLLQAEDSGDEKSDFSDISAIAVSQDGKLYLTSAAQNRIMIYSIEYEDIR